VLRIESQSTIRFKSQGGILFPDPEDVTIVAQEEANMANEHVVAVAC